MAVTDLVARLRKEAADTGGINWARAREDINKEFTDATTVPEREYILGVHKVVMDTVERQGLINPVNLENFRQVREQDFRLMLIKEAKIGSGASTIDPVKLFDITKREVQAGRLKPDDKLHKLAQAGAASTIDLRRPVYIVV
jgi:hypothetical protein